MMDLSPEMLQSPQVSGPGPIVSLDLPAGAVSSRVVREAVAVRLFIQNRFGPLREGDRTPSAGYCFDAAHLLAVALNGLNEGRWVDVEGIWFDDEGLARASEGVSPSDLDEIGQMHGFAVSEDGLVADVTADQFGLSPVVFSDNSGSHWLSRYTSEMYGGIERGKAWVVEWVTEAPAWREHAAELLAREQDTAPEPGFR
jgi:hypothetical protein